MVVISKKSCNFRTFNCAFDILVMESSSKVAKACKEMETIGIPEETVKPVLKNLLDLYDGNWKLIEDENYKALIDAIFDSHIPKREKTTNHEPWPEDEPEEWEPPLKRSHFSGQTDQFLVYPGNSSTCLGETSLGTEEEASWSQTHGKQKMGLSHHCHIEGEKSEIEPVSSLEHCNGKERRLSSSAYLLVEQTIQSGQSSNNSRAEPGCLSAPPVENLLGQHHNNFIILDSQGVAYDRLDVDDQVKFEIPLAVIPPDVKQNDLGSLASNHLTSTVVAHITQLSEDGFSNENHSRPRGTSLELMDFDHLVGDKGDGASNSWLFDIGSSAKGDVKISLICNSSQLTSYRIPSIYAVIKLVEEKYLKTYRITQPGFSLLKLMKEVCECFSAEVANCTDRNGESSSVTLTSALALSKKLSAEDVLLDGGNEVGFCIPPSFQNGVFRFRNLIDVLPQIPRVLTSNRLGFLHCIIGLNVDESGYWGGDQNTMSLEGSSHSRSLVMVQKHSSYLPPSKVPQYIDDITRGEENVKISLVNEINDECAPSFYYIPRNIAYQNAYAKFLLARISDEDCCSSCSGDCMSLAVPCACAGETGGEFAYALGGLVKEKFLEKCISMNCDPEQHDLFYCKDCPLERSSHGILSGPCKGHLVRKFIKECWYKCGCSMKCGNRVVQRGITANLQVFMTPERKGWGLRTLEDLPKGAFVCEYVGEIVTNMELFARSTQTGSTDRHTYPVLLDADWGSEGILKDEEALCLDATNFGNVARFINHRCSDPNLIEIPVEVETPDHHYYHLAFFTKRKVDALEELTWDYGIDFKDHTHPVKAFQCQCGSKFCRDKKRPKRTRSRS
ncbi:probable inactive histone-lysine N-methyltransferase SUVR2 [Diospyros lotus]|uniref:probable inactive histone-lysine N-methyltransferase SUVR2 n=1 Tax=Diospyros lotus TaxID=55363 RepID=UPI002258F632|nr:probable inactive histone-lysine N-methyltransferase SUVR2 [Diospyros lotus]XP_052189406.1 probable inactive histone-lysine N-methyltransferase SUVR2 [Diospyros lotus]